MKFLKYCSFFFSLVFILSSCGDLQEEMWLNKDGSGKLEYSMDLSESIPMFQMMMAMDTTQGDNKNKINEMFAMIDGEEVDSTFSVFQIMPDSIKNTMDNPQKFEKISINVRANKVKETVVLKLGVDFASFAEIDGLLTDLQSLSGDKLPMGGGGGDLLGGNGFDSNYYFTKKFFKRRAMNTEDGGMGGLMENEESAGMATMMFGNAKYNSILHFPYKVKSVNNPDAVIEGNTVSISKPFMEIMKPKDNKDLEIIFKKKFLGIF